MNQWSCLSTHVSRMQAYCEPSINYQKHLPWISSWSLYIFSIDNPKNFKKIFQGMSVAYGTLQIFRVMVQVLDEFLSPTLISLHFWHKYWVCIKKYKFCDSYIYFVAKKSVGLQWKWNTSKTCNFESQNIYSAFLPLISERCWPY